MFKTNARGQGAGFGKGWWEDDYFSFPLGFLLCCVSHLAAELMIISNIK